MRTSATSPASRRDFSNATAQRPLRFRLAISAYVVSDWLSRYSGCKPERQPAFAKCYRASVSCLIASP